MPFLLVSTDDAVPRRVEVNYYFALWVALLWLFVLLCVAGVGADEASRMGIAARDSGG